MNIKLPTQLDARQIKSIFFTFFKLRIQQDNNLSKISDDYLSNSQMLLQKLLF